MIIDRTEFLKAIKFLKPALGKNRSRANLMNLHVCTSGDECIMTAADSFIIKRVTLKSRSKKDNFKSWYTIDPCTLETFESLVKKHRGRKKKDYGIVEISKFNLSSMGITIFYKHSDLEYPNLAKLFAPHGDGCKEIGMFPKNLNKATSGFPDCEPVKIKIYGEHKPVIIKQLNTGYEAVVMPVALERYVLRTD